MFTVLDFINVFGQELLMGVSMSTHCTRNYKNSTIQYTLYNEKLEITIVSYNDPMYSHYTMIYDECMDWVVISRRGVYGHSDTRVHYKRVSQGHNKVPPELLNQIKLIKENMAFDHAHDMARSTMKNGKV